jgi:GNAT superfamily N-acetyltransferase
MTDLPALRIRPADVSDGDALLDLARRFATSFAVEESAFQSSFARLLADSSACLLVAETHGAVIGYVLGFQHLTFFANGRVAWVEEIMVAESHRQRGIGRQLMEAFTGWARSSHCLLVALATRRAAPFYRALGYEESATYFRKLL